MGRFSFPSNPKASCGIYKTSGMRITVLTPCLLRLETGAFTDEATQTVWNRVFPKVTVKTIQNRNIFTIETEETAFFIDVAKRKMDAVILSDGTTVTDFSSGNLLGTARTLDNINGAVRLEKGILSRSGVAVMDDSECLRLDPDGRILPRESCTDLYFFAYGSDYRRALKDFFQLTGPVPLIPKYALGNWWSRYRAYTQEEYQNLMGEFIRRELPVTVATIDMDWHWTDVRQRFGDQADPGPHRTVEEWFYNTNMPGWTGYSWNTELFPDHRALLHWLKQHGFHVTMNVHPSQGIRPYEDCYVDACRQMDLDPEKNERIPFDIADLRFVEAYLDNAHHPHEEDGVDFWWLDWQQGKVTKIPGLDPLWALNHYHTLDIGRNGKRPLILSRYAGLGSHRYPIGFSGDSHMTWESLKFQPYFTANASNAGYTWWSHDIGGHMKGYQDDELYLRWLQFGVFSPINRLHSSNSEFMGKEPWKRSWAAARISEEFLRLRHKLIPYLYTANYLTHTQGSPLCVPMYYDYSCEDAYKAKDQYLFGGQMLVCPVITPLDKRLNLSKTKVWLPEGIWTDYFNGRIYQGGQWVNMYRDLDSIPVLVRSGGIVPTYAFDRTNDLSLDQPLEIQIWHGNGSCTLYEDDGLTEEYRQGSFITTAMEVSEEGNTLRFTICESEGDASLIPQGRQMLLRFRDVVRAQVQVNGEAYSPLGPDGCVIVKPDGRFVQVLLTQAEYRKNPGKEELRNELMTRVQGDNLWKMKIYPDHLPGYLSDAMREFEAMI